MIKLYVSIMLFITLSFTQVIAQDLSKIKKGTNFFKEASDLEIKQFCKETFKNADKNKDGKIIEDEAPEAKVYNGDNKPVGSKKAWMNQFDSNNDGIVVYNEYYNRIKFVSQQLKSNSSSLEECKLCKPGK